MKRFLALIMTALVLLALVSCSGESAPSDSESTDGASASAADGMFTWRDLDSSYSEAEAILITLDGETVSASSEEVKHDGNIVTLCNEGCYIIRGTADDLSIVVDADSSAKLQLVLDGADITSADSAPILVRQADKVFVTLADKSENRLANGGEFAESDDGTDAAVFSREDISFNGTGSLEITSPSGHGIVAKDDLVIASGQYTISCASHGINANDSIRISDAGLNVTAGKDALHAENSDDEELGFVYIAGGSFELSAQGDGISASAYAQIDDGEFNITAGGGAANGDKHSSDGYGFFEGRPGGMGGGHFNKDDMPGEQPGGLPGDMPEKPEDNGEFPPDNMPDDMPGDFAPDGNGDNMPDMAPGGMEGDAPADMPGDKGDMRPDGNGAPNGGNNASPDDGETGGMEATKLSMTQRVSSDVDSDSASSSMKGIKAGGDLTINGGSFTLDCADDGLHSNSSIKILGGVLDIATGDDGVHADESLTVDACEITVSESYEGLEALDIMIVGGKIKITATDDGINSAGGTNTSGNGGRDGRFGGPMSVGNGTVVINGGTIYINASGDGIDSNGSLEINGGDITVVGPTVGDTSTLDFDTTGVINGASFFGTGASSMAQSFTGGTQAFLELKIRSTVSAGTTISVKNADGETVAQGTPELDFQYIIVSCDRLVNGEKYTVTVGETDYTCTAE